MASYVDTDGFQESRYFARSWALLTREPGWIKQVLVLWLAGLVPIAGALGIQGYLVEWARLTAWGTPTSPSRNGGSVSTYLKSGWRAFLVALVWGLIWALIAILVSIIPLANILFSVVLPVLSFVFSLVSRIAMVRSAIYQSTEAGLKFSTIGQMAERDAAGLLRILAIQLVGSLIIALISTVVFIIVLIPFAGSLYGTAQEIAFLIENNQLYYDYLLTEALIAWILIVLPVMLITGFAISFFAIMLEIVIFNALGLWLRQFNVPAWGSSDDPLPAAVPAYVPSQYAPYNPYAANAPQNQAPYAYGDTDYGMQTHGGVGQVQVNPQEGSPNHYPQG